MREKKIESSKPKIGKLTLRSGARAAGETRGEINGFAENNIELAIGAFFTSFIILIVRMAKYERPMDQFYWTNSGNILTDFFSYYKMVAVLIIASVALFAMFYRIIISTFRLKRSCAYPFMALYGALVVLSYLFSDYKEFSLLGYNQRFEGTLVVLSYIIMLFYMYNYINTEKSAKKIVYSLGLSSIILGLLGVLQVLSLDFFQTTLGRKLISPFSLWDRIDEISFRFQKGEIYQTVFNINYVSFYITLLIPVFALLFIYKQSLKKKILWGGLYALAIYNLIGSKSSGGFLGLGVTFIVALVLLNMRLLRWKKDVLIILAITVIVGGITYERWTGELSHSFRGLTGGGGGVIQTEEDARVPAGKRPYIDFIETGKDYLAISIDGHVLTERVLFNEKDQVELVQLFDSDGKQIPYTRPEGEDYYIIEDSRFYEYITLSFAYDNNHGYLQINTYDFTWLFAVTDEGVKYRNIFEKQVDLSKVEAVGWEKNQNFGSGRGYIWSRTIPLIKDNIIIGKGADTYCLVYPQHDYVGRYNVDWKQNTIVDKPHNMYMGAAIGTGLISVLALSLIYGLYLWQSFRLYFRLDFDNFSVFAGAGIFLGICGFLVAGLVNDSSVSVMPMFYGLLGTGMAINEYLLRQVSRGN